MASNARCPICKQQRNVWWIPEGADRDTIKCDRCGEFVASEELITYVWEKELSERDKEFLAALPAYIKQENEKGKTPEFNRDNWRAYAREGLQINKKSVKQ